MRAHWITDAAELRARAADWAALCDRACSDSPFGRPEWLLPWHEVFGGAAPVRVLVLEDAGAPLALVPFQEVAGRALALMGGDISDHHDAPVADDADVRGAVLPVVAHAVARGDWESIRLERLRHDAWLRQLPVVAAWRSAENAEDPPCPTLVAPASTAADAVSRDSRLNSERYVSMK